jgi:DNA-binding NarL/FixJ family response regulator
MSAVRILLADDHALVRAGIRSLIEGIDGLEIVAEASNGREAVELAAQHRPDVVVMDISMSEMNGIEAGAQIRAAVPGTKVLILSMHVSEEFVQRAVGSGVSGYLVKDSVPMELRMAIEAVVRGEIYLSPRISRHVVGMRRPASADTGRSLDALTARQREVLQMIAEGKATKEMAFLMKVSVKTIESHRAAVMDKLGIHDLAGLVIYAVRRGLVSID